ncbi:MAG: ATP-binding protein, partial [Polyangiaceae bacterium]
LLRQALVDLGYLPDIERVQTGPALELALDLRNGWDVLLCDHSLPGFDSAAALAIVKSRGIELPFIIVSSAIPEATAIDAMRSGAHDFLLKSQMARLGVVIERELRESAMRIERTRMEQQLLLSDRLVSIGSLAAGVAHEINNPLSYVIGNIEFALQRLAATRADPLAPVDMESLEHALNEAREGSERIRHTTRDLRVFACNDDSPPAPMDIQRVMNSSINMAWNEIRHRARLIRDFEHVPSVLGNEARVGQVFLNLLVNAAQALPEGDMEGQEIRVKIANDRDRVVVSIADTGAGIPPDVLARLFEPFFTTKPKGVGTGLGLAICRSIIADLGGEITVDSTLRLGTEFKVWLPTTDAVERRSLRPGPNKPDLKRLRIMIIDDEPHLRTLVRRMLSEHEVTGFRDARDALSALSAGTAFDVIFCDVMMPAMSGADFHAELTRRAPAAVKRVVFLTGGAFGASARQFLDVIENILVTKPFEVATLRSAIGRIVAANAPLAEHTAPSLAS